MSSRIGQMGSKNSGFNTTGAGPAVGPVVVLDEDGNDVTPAPLVPHMQAQVPGGMAGAGGASGRRKSHHSVGDTSMMSVSRQETVADFLNNLESGMSMAGTSNWTGSAFGRSGMMMTGMGMMASNTSKASESMSMPDDRDDDASSVTSNESDPQEDNAETSHARRGSRYEPVARRVSRALTEQDLNKMVHITLKETETICFLDIPSISVSNDNAEEVTIVKVANTRYSELKSGRANNDNFVDRGMQTFSNAPKNKDVQATNVRCTNAECMVNSYDIFDALAELEVTTEDTDGLDESLGVAGKEETDAVSRVDLTSGTSDPSVVAIKDAIGSVAGVGSSLTLASSAVDGEPMLSNLFLGTGAAGAMGSTSIGIPVGDDSFSFNQSVMMDNHSETNYSSIGIEGSGAHIKGDRPDGDKSKTKEERDLLSSLKQDSLRKSLLIVERAVIENNYSKKWMMYRNMPDNLVPDPDVFPASSSAPLTATDGAKDPNQGSGADTNPAKAGADVGPEPTSDGPNTPGRGQWRGPKQTNANLGDSGSPETGNTDAAGAGTGAVGGVEEHHITNSLPILQFLWAYRCELTRGRVVNYIVWNKHNEDILAVGYSECKYDTNATAGLILCWSIKNPEWPERIYKNTSPVTAIDFSRANPNLLACGFMDGRIAIYDVRSKSKKPVLDNSGLAGKHRDAVWELQWVEHEHDHGDEHTRGEVLVSISTDGRVTQWSIRKGFECIDLMTLKRVTKQHESKGTSAVAKSGAFIARQSGGLCFDFNPKDSNMYLVGTDDGHIHRCSCSYNEQYLSTHFGHTGPVYRVRWSPFLPGAFLTCSADWTVRLWSQETDDPVFNFQSGKDTITYVAWSPNSSTMFGCVSTDGRLEIWDLQHSVLDPIVLHTVLDRQLTCIVFGSKSPVVLIGDNNGAVSVYTLQKSDGGPSAPAAQQPKSREQQAQQLADIMSSKNNNENQ
ncbi:WD repeat-containing protein 78 [Quaeritorhiza haematococci]|nr:WD repeat-containing protein 78 [Quaeritorhiza haematococci]